MPATPTKPDPCPTADQRLATGIFPIAPTPFTATGDLDLDGMRRVLDCMIDQQVDGICILANYSEQFLLSDVERDTLLKLCLTHVAGRVPVIVTTSHFSAQLAMARAKAAHPPTARKMKCRRRWTPRSPSRSRPAHSRCGLPLTTGSVATPSGCSTWWPPTAPRRRRCWPTSANSRAEGQCGSPPSSQG